MYFYRPVLLRLGIFSSIILSLCAGHLLPLIFLLLLDLIFFIVFQISWIFCVRKILDLTFSLTDVSISHIISSTSVILSSISYIMLVMFIFVVPVHLPRFWISMILSVCISFIFSPYISRSWPVLFIFFTCLVFFFGLS